MPDAPDLFGETIEGYWRYTLHFDDGGWTEDARDDQLSTDG